MKLTERQMAELEKCRMDFLWKVQIFEMGLRYNHEAEKKICLHDRVKETAKYNFNISDMSIMHQCIGEIDYKHFAYELGRYIESIRTEIVREMNQFNYPLDAICGTYEEQVKKIFL